MLLLLLLNRLNASRKKHKTYNYIYRYNDEYIFIYTQHIHIEKYLKQKINSSKRTLQGAEPRFRQRRRGACSRPLEELN